MSDLNRQENSPLNRATQVANVAGELEREACSRRTNLIEAFALMLAVLGTLWGVAYPLGVLTSSPAGNVASRALVGGLIFFVAVISPRLHGDSLNSWGIGSPARLWRVWRRAHKPTRIVLAAVFTGAIIVLTLELYRNATGAGQFILGLEPAVTFRLQNELGGKLAVLALCLGLSFVWATCVIRYDNFWPALKAAGKILAALLPMTLLVGWLLNGPAVFLDGKPWALLRNGLGYIFWGALQQLLFCSYFGTRLRKGFGPAQRPELRKWKRLAVATLNGLFFGLIHINSWLLVSFAWVLGIFLSWFFMEDRYRNLQALGFVHGVLGTCVIWLFSEEPAPVHIRLRVGPWSMPHRVDLLTLSVVGLAVAGLAIALVLTIRQNLALRQSSQEAA